MVFLVPFLAGTSIIFVDLAGSTKFKADNGPVLGLEKTFIHNSFVTKAVANKGDVVKYIGGLPRSGLSSFW